MSFAYSYPVSFLSSAQWTLFMSSILCIVCSILPPKNYVSELNFFNYFMTHALYHHFVWLKHFIYRVLLYLM